MKTFKTNDKLIDIYIYDFAKNKLQSKLIQRNLQSPQPEESKQDQIISSEDQLEAEEEKLSGAKANKKFKRKSKVNKKEKWIAWEKLFGEDEYGLENQKRIKQTPSDDNIRLKSSDDEFEDTDNEEDEDSYQDPE